jgi:CheY-like chemotaxis protein
MLMTTEPMLHNASMVATPHILVVEDDREISALVARYLRANDCRVSVADDGRAMDRVLAESRIDLIVLDLMLPGEDGLSLCRRLRAASAIPIVMLTAKGEDIDRIIGLEMGADVGSLGWPQVGRRGYRGILGKPPNHRHHRTA